MTLVPCVSKSCIGRAIDYDPASGAFTWRVRTSTRFPHQGRRESWNAQRAGKPAGCREIHSGKLRISIGSKNYYAARLAFILVTGAAPDSRVIYRDGDGSNLRWANLTTTRGLKAERAVPVAVKRARPRLSVEDLLLNYYLSGGLC